MNRYLSFLALGTVLLFSCNEPHTDETAETGTHTGVERIQPRFSKIDTALNTQVQGIYDAYIKLKDALIEDKQEDAAFAAISMNLMIVRFKDSTIPPDQTKVYNAVKNKILSLSTDIGREQDIRKQRQLFAMLSEEMFGLIRTFGSKQPVYLEYCNMAFDGNGASWLSNSAHIENPYFGHDMLNCGEVTMIIKHETTMNSND